MNPPLFPINLKLEGLAVLVVGGGTVASRRVESFLAGGADVTVVSPEISVALSNSHHDRRITWHARRYETADLDDAWLVQTATGITEIDDRVAQDARELRIFCFKGGDPEGATAWRPAVSRVDNLTVAVSGGGDARRAITISQQLTEHLRTLPMPTRSPRTRTSGIVHLVGGGPGDPDLITVRGRRLLSQADVVVVDRLGPRALLSELGEHVEILEVGKRPTVHAVPQEQINTLLVDRAQQGLRVVRLKGGDPFVFGRGGEEANTCRDAGIEVEVVPGISSSISAPAAAGIPLTHRGTSRGFTVMTAHDDFGAVPDLSDHTLVLLMGVGRLAHTVEALLKQGHPPELPVAIIENGNLPEQRVIVGALTTIVDAASDASVTAPAVIVIGAVAAMADTRDANDLGENRRRHAPRPPRVPAMSLLE